jgi:hypothetical protein
MPAAYAGNSANYPAAVNVLSGSDLPNSTNFNTTSEATIDRTAYLAAAIPHVGQSWRPSFPGSSLLATGQPYKPAWDYNIGAWLVPYMVGPTLGAYALYVSWSHGLDDGGFWTQIGGAGSEIDSDTTGILDAAACADPATAGIVWSAALLSNSANLVIKDSSYTSSSWTTKFTQSLAGGTSLTVEMAGIGSRVVVGVGGSSGPVNGLFTGGTGASFTQAESEPFATDWSVKSNGSLLIALPTECAPTILYTTTDGITFTSRSITSLVPAGATTVGVAWSPLTALWYLCVQVTSSEIKIYSSPDGITWTAVTSATGPDIEAADFEVQSNGMMVTTIDTPVLSLTTAAQFFFSPDFGVSWYPNTFIAPALFPSNLASSAVGYSRARLASSTTQFLATNSKYGRFSNVAGLPPGI